LDEPTSGLDQNTAIKIIYLMKQISKSCKIPVVAAIHHPARIALENADSLYVLYQGYGVFQGNYQDLKEVVGDQESSTECPLSYTFDNIGIDDYFRKRLFEHHILTFNNDCLPGIQAIINESEAEGNNPNTVIVSNELSMSSIPDCTVPLLALFINSLGSQRATVGRLLHFGRIHCSGLTVLALGILLPGLVGEQLPISNNMGGVVAFSVVWMIFISTTISVFHVSVGLDLVENEAKHFYALLFERLIHPKHVTIFLCYRAFLLPCSLYLATLFSIMDLDSKDNMPLIRYYFSLYTVFKH